MTYLDRIDDLDEALFVEDGIEFSVPLSSLNDSAFSDAKYVDGDHAAIDMQIEHPTYGLIPITISEAEYPELWARVVASGEVLPYTPPSDDDNREAWRKTAFLSRVEFCTALRAAGILNRSEAIAAAKGDWPASFEPMLDTMTEAEADAALILWAGITIIERNHPLLEAVRQFKGLSQEDVDALFGYQS